MIRHAVIPGLFSATLLVAAETQDLLRFTNGDQLHGSFLGIKEGPQAVWRRDDLPAPVDFKTTSIRHVVLHGGRPLKPLGSLSHLGLVNGDRVPGTVTGIDAEFVTLDTPSAGLLKIARRQVAMLAPNPMGGRVFYYGPFGAEDWKMVHPAFPDGLPPEVKEDADKAKPAAAKEGSAKEGNVADDEPNAPGRWSFSGAAWYWQNKQAGTALIREDGMPDRAVLGFDLSWKNRLSISIGFHADFAKPEAEEGDEDKGRVRAFVPGDTSDLPRLFGNSYVLQMYSSYLMLYRCAVDEEGKASLERVQLNNNNLRLGESGKAHVEIRSNRRSGSISLFVNGEFVAQWSESDLAGRQGEGYAGKGAGFGFVVQGDDAPLRLSDIVVSEWNGMPDSARSLQVDDQDVVLLANGTDRYAGRIAGYENANLLFEGKHGSFRFPLAEVAEVRFAKERLAEAGEVPADNFVVRMHPLGSISGRPVSGDQHLLGMVSPLLGELNLSLDSAVMLDFNSSNQIIDDWDADF
jgi:hypothetical protein